MPDWEVSYLGKLPTLKQPVFIEGLPGVGSVGKIALDFVIESVKAKRVVSFSSNAFPPSVFVNEQNVVELPSIALYYKKVKDKDYLFLSGDLQPVNEESCYSFSSTVLDILERFQGSRIITLGGIGLQNVPKKPQVFCTGNDKRFIDQFRRGTYINPQLYGVIGPIVGISGVLLGLAGRRGIPALTLLVETYAHPMYLGIDGSRELLKVLKERCYFDVDLDVFENQVAELQKEHVLEEPSSKMTGGTVTKKTNYIG